MYSNNMGLFSLCHGKARSTGLGTS